jgi:hypothetical protein
MPRSSKLYLSLRFLYKNLYAPLPFYMHATGPSISFFLIWPLEQYLVRSSDHKTHYADSFPPTSSLLRQQIILSTYSQTPQPMFFPIVKDQILHSCKQDEKLFFCIF